ncbi:hypothetical protein [Benzoatithermus flavus]|uniref:Uncharacterized protein n=1 Tax=Benzoatithermus flavus TaxID=3108223 RepID=A0ABU8XMR9_9PROT
MAAQQCLEAEIREGYERDRRVREVLEWGRSAKPPMLADSDRAHSDGAFGYRTVLEDVAIALERALERGGGEVVSI